MLRLLKVTYLIYSGIRVINVNSGKHLVKSCAIFRINNHLILIEVKVDPVVIPPDLRCQL